MCRVFSRIAQIKLQQQAMETEGISAKMQELYRRKSNHTNDGATEGGDSEE